MAQHFMIDGNYFSVEMEEDGKMGAFSLTAQLPNQDVSSDV